MNNPDRYPAEVFWSDEDEGFIAIAPDLPGCSAFGEDQASALVELKHAITAWQEAAASAGNPIPAPSQPAADVEYSGKFVLRVAKTMHRSLASSAQREGVSLNQYVVTLLSAAQSLQAVETRIAGIYEAQSLNVHTCMKLIYPTRNAAVKAAITNVAQTGTGFAITGTGVVDPAETRGFMSSINPLVYARIGGSHG